MTKYKVLGLAGGCSSFVLCTSYFRLYFVVCTSYFSGANWMAVNPVYLRSV
jgi:hypothetical protein